MADSPKYRVIVSGVVLPEKSRAEVIDKLVTLFHSQRDTMEKLLQGKATPLTREYEREPAEKICRAIREAGAECRMEEIGASEPPMEETSAHQETEQGDSSADTEDQPASPTAESSSALMRFVSVNTEYYARQFAKFGDREHPSFALSWHWPAFFVFFFWAVYRKLWLWASVNLAGGIVLALLAEPGIMYLAWALFWSLTANYLYFRHARNQVFDNPDADADVDSRPVHTDARGGVSRGAVWVGIIVMFLFSLALNNLIVDRVLERYAEQIGENLPQPGSRQRGDGSAIDDLATLEPMAAKTVGTLGVLAVTLKLAASGKGLDDSQLALSVFERVIAQKKINDAWGQQITLRQDASGQVVLASAGPDGRPGNEDDFLQYVRLDSL